MDFVIAGPLTRSLHIILLQLALALLMQLAASNDKKLHFAARHDIELFKFLLLLIILCSVLITECFY